MKNSAAWIGVLCGLMLFPDSSTAQTDSEISNPRIAITVDDIPWNGVAPPDGIDGGTARLIDALRSRGIGATAFVVCDRMAPGAPAVRAWLDAGMAVGSHSAAHRDIDDGLDLWLDDVDRCAEVLESVTGVRGGYFRYPYLHEGSTRAVRDSAAAHLAALGYRNAPVTIDNSEWILARAYGTAIERGDTARQRAIGEAYVEHIVDAARHFRELSNEKFGRDIDHVLLVHANALNADWLGQALDALTRQGFAFANLDAVLEDPVYALPDAYVGPRGLSWIYRATPLTPSDPWDETAERALEARFPR